MNGRIVLVGNGTNYNRGCEAIARGTLAIFNAVSSGRVALTSGVIVQSDAAENMVRSSRSGPEEPPQFPLRPHVDNSLAARAGSKALRRRRRYRFPSLAKELSDATQILEVGGDNYSLDYGRPYTFIDLDNEVRRSGVPLAIWGASIGPFSADPGFEDRIMAHLRTLDHIFVRETVSLNYLEKLGLENLTLMADPAILMAPRAPANLEWEVEAFKGAIGINLSPFQARQLSRRNHAYWETDSVELAALADFGAELVSWILRNDDRPVLLVPHVMAPEAWNNDHVLLVSVRNRLEDTLKQRVAVLPGTMNAPELKWALGQCSIFVGSRTHATLGAISSGVPTLAFGYSCKAIGLMRDLYGNDEMCLKGDQLNFQNAVSSLQRLIQNEATLRAMIAEKLPSLRESAYNAGRMMLAMGRILRSSA